MRTRHWTWPERALTVIALALIAAPLACDKQPEIEPESSGGTGGSGGTTGAGGSATGGGGSAGTASGSAGADASTILPSELACPPGLAGPKLVRIQTADDIVYCMDQREVTWGEYKAFVAAKASDTSGQPAECSWNTTYQPQYQPWDDDGELLTGECPFGSEHKSDDQAVNCVDFCDALAYCEWAGKRLCGRVGGPSKWGRVYVGATDDPAQKQALSDLAGTTAVEFGHACTQGAKTTYAYGNAYEPGRCIDWTWVQQKGETSLAVTDLSNRTCHGTEGPFSQIWDLSGSVEEWQNVCWEGLTGSCLLIGGSWGQHDKDRQACAADIGFGSARTASQELGFRCCADGVPIAASKP